MPTPLSPVNGFLKNFQFSQYSCIFKFHPGDDRSVIGPQKLDQPATKCANSGPAPYGHFRELHFLQALITTSPPFLKFHTFKNTLQARVLECSVPRSCACRTSTSLEVIREFDALFTAGEQREDFCFRYHLRRLVLKQQHPPAFSTISLELQKFLPLHFCFSFSLLALLLKQSQRVRTVLMDSLGYGWHFTHHIFKLFLFYFNPSLGPPPQLHRLQKPRIIESEGSPRVI